MRIPTAVEFEKALVRLTPEIAAELYAQYPVAYRDQMGAVTTDARRLAKIGYGTQPAELDLLKIDEWLRLGMLDVFIRWAADTVDTCMHMPSIDRPEPVWGCAWKPNLVVCKRCMPLLKVTGDANITCDCCGGVFASGVTPLAVGYGPMTYSAGACETCTPHSP